MSHNFGSRYARKSVKGSKDLDDGGLVSKATWAKKMARWVGAQGQVILAKKVKTCDRYDVSPRKRKKKKVFLVWTSRLAESVEGLDSFLAQSAGDV